MRFISLILLCVLGVTACDGGTSSKDKAPNNGNDKSTQPIQQGCGSNSLRCAP